ERLIRWEVMRAQMSYGVVVNGVLVEEGIGRVLHIPLHMSRVPVTQDSVAIRLAAFDNPQVAAIVATLWDDVLAAAGALTAPVYFAVWKELVSSLLVHLSLREVHQLVTLEAELDFDG